MVEEDETEEESVEESEEEFDSESEEESDSESEEESEDLGAIDWVARLVLFLEEDVRKDLVRLIFFYNFKLSTF